MVIDRNRVGSWMPIGERRVWTSGPTELGFVAETHAHSHGATRQRHALRMCIKAALAGRLAVAAQAVNLPRPDERRRDQAVRRLVPRPRLRT